MNLVKLILILCSGAYSAFGATPVNNSTVAGHKLSFTVNRADCSEPKVGFYYDGKGEVSGILDSSYGYLTCEVEIPLESNRLENTIRQLSKSYLNNDLIEPVHHDSLRPEDTSLYYYKEKLKTLTFKIGAKPRDICRFNITRDEIKAARENMALVEDKIDKTCFDKAFDEIFENGIGDNLWFRQTYYILEAI